MSSIRKVTDDAKMRPFLSTHFDAQAYIKTVIKDGRSEECFQTISTCIDEVNEEIKGYISQNKESLMSGMQDVAQLSERYSNLYSTSQKLQRNVERLKKEALESYDLVKLRTEELERIHSTSMVLRQLRQFVHCKAQLDHLLKATNEADGGASGGLVLNGDIRHLASAAKSLHELEGVLTIPALLEITLVAQQVKAIQEFGRQLRQLAQEKLLSALRERNQAYVAASLQVFFNLESLPEIVLLAIDTTVKQTVELSRGAIDLDALVAAHTELATATGSGSSATGLAGTLASRAVQKKGGPGAAAGVSSAALPNSTQLRVAMREVAHQWGSLVSEQAMQIHVLQRVVAKKEDPNTHVKFVDVLRALHSHGAGGAAVASGARLQYLASGRLLDLFWHRLHAALPDVAAEKLRLQPLAASRMYPYLRKAAVEAADNLKMLSNRDLSRDALAGLGHAGTGAGGVLGSAAALADGDVEGLGEAGAGGATSSQVQGMFGSLAWASGGGIGGGGRGGGAGDHGLLNMLGMGSRRSSGAPHAADAARRQRDELLAVAVAAAAAAGADDGDDGSGADGARGVDDRRARRSHRISGIVSAAGMGFGDGDGGDALGTDEADTGLVGGLKPLRDRYLAGALSRMTAPVLQMFPEMEGYTAAIPSKRDMQALIKALQAELAMAAVEGDQPGGLLRAVCKEAVKSVQLMVSKVEGMVVSTAEAKKIAVGAGTAPAARTAQQEHNAQLVALLAQLREALQRMPTQVMAAAAAGKSEEEAASAVQKQVLVTRVLRAALAVIDDVAARQVLAPLVDAIAAHVKTQLLPLLKEGVTTTNTAGGVGGPGDGAGVQVDCSRAVQIVAKQLPDLAKTYLLGLAKCPAVTAALEELGLRVLHVYVTVAALARPVNEALRLRTAKDMSVVEAAVATAGLAAAAASPRPADDDEDDDGAEQTSAAAAAAAHSNRASPVVDEFRAFRRLLFMDDATGGNAGSSGAAGGASAGPPSRGRLLAMPFAADLRPSTLLGHLAACAPPQLPSPTLPDAAAAAGTAGTVPVQGYVDLLTAVPVDAGSTVGRHGVHFPSVAALYVDKAAVDGAGGAAEWRAVMAEVRSWECLQGALDVFVQRISVADSTQGKQQMRAWYEAIQDIGGHYFANS